MSIFEFFPGCELLAVNPDTDPFALSNIGDNVAREY